MGWIPSRGEEVVVEGLGPGLVLRIDRNTALIALRDSQLKIEIGLDQLMPARSGGLVSEDIHAPTLGLPRVRKSPIVPAQFEKLKSLEALRFGLVPTEGLADLTLGFGSLKKWTISRLPHSHDLNPQVSEVYGPFGSGKSHTMAAIRHIASEQGYVAARVEVDGQSISLSNPERLLFALWSTLWSSNHHSSTPILDLCARAIQDGHAPPFVAPRGIDRVRDNYSTARLLLRSNLVDTWGHALDAVMCSSDEFTASDVSRSISAEPTIYALDVTVRKMIGQKVKDRPYDFVETLVGYAMLARLAGHKGLVITIDEFEVERYFLTRTHFERVAALVQVLNSYLKGDLDHPRAPLAMFFATVGEEGHVGDQVVDALVDGARGGYYQLAAWSRESRADLAKRIHAIYREAYALGDAYSEELFEAVEAQLERQGDGDGGLIRAFIKSYVCALDSVYRPQPP